MPHTDPHSAEARIDQLISLEARDVQDGCLVSVAGELDMVTTPHLRTYLKQRVEEVKSLLVVDLREVEFLGSSGLAVLVETLTQARDRGISLRLVCDSREVIRPLEATGLTDLFEIHSTADAALATG